MADEAAKQDRLLADHYAQQYEATPFQPKDATDAGAGASSAAIEVTEFDMDLGGLLNDLDMDAMPLPPPPGAQQQQQQQQQQPPPMATPPRLPTAEDAAWSTERSPGGAFPSMFAGSPGHFMGGMMPPPPQHPHPHPPPQQPDFNAGALPPSSPLPAAAAAAAVAVMQPPAPSVIVGPDGEATPEVSLLQSHLMLPLAKKHYTTMGKSEMAYIIRAQLRQLQSADPLSEDFYYQVHNARTGRREAAPGFPTLEGFHAHAHTRNADGTMKASSSTLGRLEASNLRRPKKLMDLQGAAVAGIDGETTTTTAGDDVAAAAADRRGNMFSRHSLAYLAEEGIRILMDIEDVDSILVAMPPPMADPRLHMERARLEQHRHALVSRLCAYMDLSIGPQPPRPITDQHMLYGFAKARKGRLLVFRSLLLLPPMAAEQIIFVMMARLDVFALCDAPYDADARLANLAADFMYNMPLPAVNMLFMSLINGSNRTLLVKLIQSMMGCALTRKILQKGHDEQMNFTVAAHQVPPPPIALDAWKVDIDVWRRTFDEFVSLIADRVADLFSLHADPASADGITTASVEWLWDLVAAMMSQSSLALQQVLKAEVSVLLKTDVSPIVRADKTMQAHATDEPWHQAPFVSGAVRYLAALCLPEDAAVVDIFRRLDAIQVVEVAAEEDDEDDEDDEEEVVPEGDDENDDGVAGGANEDGAGQKQQQQQGQQQRQRQTNRNGGNGNDPQGRRSVPARRPQQQQQQQQRGRGGGGGGRGGGGGGRGGGRGRSNAPAQAQAQAPAPPRYRVLTKDEFPELTK